jgi:hypothetical protein
MMERVLAILEHQRWMVSPEHWGTRTAQPPKGKTESRRAKLHLRDPENTAALRVLRFQGKLFLVARYCLSPEHWGQLEVWAHALPVVLAAALATQAYPAAWATRKKIR